MGATPCGEELQTLLSRYVDGELPPEERRRVDEHVGSCEPCRDLLSLFQKNENLVAGALGTDAFGNAVVASVMGELRREGPPEARPVEEGLGDWLRARPWLQIAAAALLVVGLVGVLGYSHNRQMDVLRGELSRERDQVEGLRNRNLRTSASLEEQTQRQSRLAEEFRQFRSDVETSNVLTKAAPGTILGYVEADHYLVIKASFDTSLHTGYHVFRRGEHEKEDKSVRLNEKPLAKPEFTDRSAKPGHGYVYRFEAMNARGETVASMPIFMRLPFSGDLAPDQSLRIHCEELAAPKDLALFRIERLVAGRPVSHRFYVRLGQRVGGLAQIEGAGEVDFTTDFVLSKIEEGTEPRSIRMTAPVLDAEGRTVILRIENNVPVPKTEHYEVSVGSRLSMFAVLKPVGTPDGRTDMSIWRGSWMRVRAR
jgi:hypothetical protein